MLTPSCHGLLALALIGCENDSTSPIEEEGPPPDGAFYGSWQVVSYSVDGKDLLESGGAMLLILESLPGCDGYLVTKELEVKRTSGLVLV